MNDYELYEYDEYLDNMLTTKPKDEHQPPPKFVVVLHVDPTIPQSFIIHVLHDHIGIPTERASDIALEAHMGGTAVVQMYPTRDIAETVVAEALTCVAIAFTDLTLTVEPEDE